MMLFPADSQQEPLDQRSWARLAGGMLARLFEIVPRRFRFVAAVAFARAIVPAIRRTEAFRSQREFGLDTPHEIALHFVLNALTREGTEFDPRIDASAFEVITLAKNKERGVLVIAPHAVLSLMILRRIFDQGLELVAVTPDPHMQIPGRRRRMNSLQPSYSFLIKARNILKRGGLICAMPDRREHERDRTIEFSTGNGRIILAPALLHVSERTGAEIVFVEIHLEGWRLVARIAGCAPDAGAVGAFVDFVRSGMEQRSLGDVTTPRPVVARA